MQPVSGFEFPAAGQHAAPGERPMAPASGMLPRGSASPQLLPELISARAQLAPDTPALAGSDETVSYGDLQRRANQLAHRLRELGVGPEVVVAVCVERSPLAAVAALAILKAGGAYLPIDPAYPQERIAFMLQDSQVPLLLGRTSMNSMALPGGCKLLPLDAPRETQLITGQPATDPLVPHRSVQQLAYLIYTSGSEGHPKGVEITHGSLLNLVMWHLRAFHVSPSDRASQVASFGFDAAVWEMWPYLAAGASVHFCPEAIRVHAELLREWFCSEKITIGFVPTPHAEQLLRLTWPPACALRALLTGADTLHSFPSADLPFTLVNNYGPTEATVVASSAVVPAYAGQKSKPSIGAPIDHTRVYVLDEHLQPVAPGRAGEICIAGAGVARGYRNRPALNREKFILASFGSAGPERLYRTGDLGRLLPDGQIEFLGRIDAQIKIRGYRVEPNEVVAILDRHPGVSASTVVAREGAAGEKQLVAYIVPRTGSELSAASLEQFARKYLPDYMIPSIFVRLQSLPLNPHGKLDCSRLPQPDAENVISEECPLDGESTLQEKIASILCSLLHTEHVDIHDNFFFLGGHSLLGTQLIARVRDVFGVELPLRRIFDCPTVAELSLEVGRLIDRLPPGGAK